MREGKLLLEGASTAEHREERRGATLEVKTEQANCVVEMFVP